MFTLFTSCLRVVIDPLAEAWNIALLIKSIAHLRIPGDKMSKSSKLFTGCRIETNAYLSSDRVHRIKWGEERKNYSQR